MCWVSKYSLLENSALRFFSAEDTWIFSATLWNSVECNYMVEKSVVCVMCMKLNRGVRLTPGGNLGPCPELDSSGCTCNVIICVGTAVNWTGVFWRLASTHCSEQWEANRSPVHSISRAYIVKYMALMMDIGIIWSSAVPGVWYCFQSNCVVAILHVI
jgi:hypothetical protein